MIDTIASICFIALSASMLLTLILGMDIIEPWQSVEICIMCILGSLILEVRAALRKIWEKLDNDVSIK